MISPRDLLAKWETTRPRLDKKNAWEDWPPGLKQYLVRLTAVGDALAAELEAHLELEEAAREFDDWFYAWLCARCDEREQESRAKNLHVLAAHWCNAKAKIQTLHAALARLDKLREGEKA